MKHSINLSLQSDLGRGSAALASCKRVALGVGLEHGRELHEETSTSLHYHLVLCSDWRKPSSPLQAGCKVELGKGLRSSW